MRKYFKFIIAGLIALVFIGTFVFLWIKSQPKAVVYDEFTPKVMDLKKTTVITGKIEPRNEVNVKPQISGIISEIMKEAGQMIQRSEEHTSELQSRQYLVCRLLLENNNQPQH